MFKIIPIIVLAILAALVVPEIKITSAQERPLKVTYEDLNRSARQQVDCLAQNMYFESGWEPVKGQIAVAKIGRASCRERVSSPV